MALLSCRSVSNPIATQILNNETIGFVFYTLSENRQEKGKTHREEGGRWSLLGGREKVTPFERKGEGVPF